MRRLAAPLLLFALCTGFYWKLTLTGDYTFLDSPDLANLDFPRLQFQSASLRQSYIPLWDPFQWAGQPFLGQVTSSAYPVNWFLAYFPVDDGGKLSLKGMHWYYVLLHYFAALFCYLLCRDWKRSEAGSVIAGLVFALGGFAGNTDWPQILNGVLWLPLVVLFAMRALRGHRVLFSGAMSGAMLGLAWLSGHHEVPIYATTAMAGVWLTAIAVGPRREEAAKGAAAALVAMLLTAALQIVPAQEYALLSKRWAGAGPLAWNEAIPYSVHQHFSWSAEGVLGIVTPRMPVHVNPFIGILAFSLAVLGVYHGWRRLPQARLLVGLAMAGLFLALAANNVFHGLLYAALPVFGKARVPARAIALLSFALAPLAAYGYDALGRRSSPWLRRTVIALAIAGALLYAVEAFALRAAQPHEQPMLTALMATVAAVLLAAWRAGAVHRPLAGIAITLLVMVEIGNVTGGSLNNLTRTPHPGYLERLYQHDDIANYLRARPQPVRMEVSDADIPYNFGEWHGIPTLGGFAASATANLLEMEKHKPRVQDLLGVNYYVGHSPPRPDLTYLTDTSSGLNIYHNPAALPRVWTVHKATQAASMTVINRRLDSPEFQPRMEALLLGAPPPVESCAEADEVGPAEGRSPNRVHLDAKLACRGLLILSDTWFPGWRARVDGRDTEILPVFGALRGIVVDKGQHHIEFSYLPASAKYGAAGTVAGIFFVFWTMWHTRNRRSA
ncbi:MAG: hypothetical protein HYX27_13805 [Acidobacteria bacterium]|nr:hypothetical protein [Acidobacteriota bacterium]